MREAVGNLWRGAAVRWLLLVIAIVAILGWVLAVRPAAPVWGDVATWVGGIATSGALAAAAYQIRLGTEQRKAEAKQRVDDEAERRLAMARAVGLRTVVTPRAGRGWQATYKLHNGSDFPISDVLVAIGDPGAEVYDPVHQQGTAFEVVIGAVFPKETVGQSGIELNLSARGPAFAEATWLGVVRFTDVWGQNWSNSAAGLERQEHGPLTC